MRLLQEEILKIAGDSVGEKIHLETPGPGRSETGHGHGIAAARGEALGSAVRHGVRH